MQSALKLHEGGSELPKVAHLVKRNFYKSKNESLGRICISKVEDSQCMYVLVNWHTQWTVPQVVAVSSSN